MTSGGFGHNASARNIVDTVLRRGVRNGFTAILTLHARSVLFTDAATVVSQEQLVCSNEILALWRDPLGALPWLDVENVHGIGLLETTTLTLTDEEISDDGTSQAAGGEDVSVLVVDGAGNVWCEEGDEEIPDPVRGGGETHSGGSVASRVDFSSNAPDDWPPSGGVPEDEECGEDDHGSADLWCVGGHVAIERKVAKRCKDHETHEHPQTTSDE